MTVPLEVTGRIRSARERPELSHTFDGTNDEDSPCCTFAVTLINKKPAPWPWFAAWSLWSWLRWLFQILLSWLPWQPQQAIRVRITALGGTTILNAYPDEWNQLTAFPTSVIWEPGQGLPLPWGDPADGEIDQDFLLSLGPGTGVKNLKVETLASSGAVLDVFEIVIPCFPAEEVDYDTDWDQYTSILQGGQNVFVYLEPDDCDPGEFDYRASCSIIEINRTCAPAGNAYMLTLEGPQSSQTTSYEWSIDGQGFTDTSSSSHPHVYEAGPLAPGSYSVTVTIEESTGNPQDPPIRFGCGTFVHVLGVDPHFTWEQDPCTKVITLDASSTANSDLVAAWEWTCPSFSIPSFEVVQFDPGLGSYEVTLHAVDVYGCEWNVTRTVEVVTCSASFTAVYSWCVGKINPDLTESITVSFTNTSVVCNPVFGWDFAGLGSSSVRNPTFTFPNVAHGDERTVTLQVNDLSSSCVKTFPLTITFQQREYPDFSFDICPNGLGTFRTSAGGPVWTLSPAPPSPAPKKLRWPYSEKDGSPLMYCFEDGAYTMKLDSTDANLSHCSATKSFLVQRECCTKYEVQRVTSGSITVQLNSGLEELRVRARLWQLPLVLGSRIGAKTFLFKKGPNGWRRFKSKEVELEASFTGTVYGVDLISTGCRCATAEATNASKKKLNRRKVRAADSIAGLLWDPLLAKQGSVVSNHAVTVGGQTYSLLSLSLGGTADCEECNWWNNLFWI